METKPWYQSKIIWFNALYAVAALAAMFGFANFHPDQGVVEVVSAGLAILNVILRKWFANTPIE